MTRTFIECHRGKAWPAHAASIGLLLSLMACGGGNHPPAAAGFVPPTSNFCTATADNLFSACEA